MTMLAPTNVTCALCGKNSVHKAVASTNTMGSPDLDLRPAPMARSTIHTWVQECPECGYCAPSLNQATDTAKAVVTGADYQSQLRNQDYPGLANAFLCQGLISERAGALPEAVTACIHAAWACDDESQTEAASRCRNEAVRLIKALHDQGKRLYEQPGADEAILTDLLRRAGRFEEALDVVDGSIGEVAENVIRAVLRYQKGLISRGDVAAHRIKEAVPG